MTDSYKESEWPSAGDVDCFMIFTGTDKNCCLSSHWPISMSELCSRANKEGKRHTQ